MEVAREDSGDGDFEPCEMLMDRFGVRKEVWDGDFDLRDRFKDLSASGGVLELDVGDADLELLDRFRDLSAREEGLELEVGGMLGEDRA